MESKCKLSIIISTINRSQILENLLKILLDQEYGKSVHYEIVVVDNCSSDGTASVVKSLQKDSDRIKYVYESRKGLSVARNAGVRYACGEIITFLDDDVIPQEDFVQQIINSFELNSVVCVGGRIVALWPHNMVPIWFSSKFANVVGETSFGEASRFLNRDEFPFGGNISFKKDIFERFNGFNEKLGRVGTGFLTGEEVDLCFRIQKAGGRFYYNANAKVLHIVGDQRANKKYFLMSLWGKGITEGFQKMQNKGVFLFWWFFLLKFIYIPVLFLFYFLIIFSAKNKFRVLCDLVWSLGYVYSIFTLFNK